MTTTPSPPTTRRAPVGLPDHLRHYIDGAHVDSASGARFDVLEPWGNEVYLTAAAGEAADVDRAVAAATRAFTDGPWPRMTPRARAAVLVRVAEAVASSDQRLAELETYDTGLPIAQALGQAQRAAENFRFFADLIVAQHDEAYQVAGRQLNYVDRTPVGVAGLITPWNTPFMLESWKLAPALAAGCTVVLKPAEFTPLSASLWAQIFEDAGLPAGVFNLVHGIGEVAGDALVRHPDVPLLSFTGESSTGATIYATAAPLLKTVSMELGGKSPVVICDDADLDAALDSSLYGAFSLNGERCTAGSRLLVQRGIHDEFSARFAARASAIVVGDPADPRTEVGPLVHPEHHAKVAHYIEVGTREARRLTGGEASSDSLGSPNHVPPTVFDEVDRTAQVFTDEIFGPVVTITSFDTDDEALALANATRYGLAAYVWTSSLDRAQRFTHGIDCGMVWVNSHNVRDLRTPFGGIKASGVGREGGYRSLDFYTHEKAVHLTTGALEPIRFGADAEPGNHPEQTDSTQTDPTQSDPHEEATS